MAQDCSLRSIIAYLFVVVASVLALTYADRHAGAKEAAGYSYVAPQVAPPVASRLSMAQLDAILNETAPNTPYLVAYQLKTTDAHGAVASAAPLKVVPTDDPARPYLGVFHNPINTTQFATYLGYSNDLKTWHTLPGILWERLISQQVSRTSEFWPMTAYCMQKNTIPPAGLMSACSTTAMPELPASKRSSPILPSHRRMH